MPDNGNGERRMVRQTFIRVMLVQVVTLVLLWLLQSRFSG
jgi:hypothetical protein